MIAGGIGDDSINVVGSVSFHGADGTYAYKDSSSVKISGDEGDDTINIDGTISTSGENASVIISGGTVTILFP